MIRQINQVKEFHKAYGLPIEPVAAIPRVQRVELRNRLLLEEAKETYDAETIVEAADGITDVLYVAFGTVLEYGLQDYIVKLFDEVHKSNMSKLDANGKSMKRPDGKILKGPNYFKPRILHVLNGIASMEQEPAYTEANVIHICKKFLYFMTGHIPSDELVKNFLANEP